jgi:hypothetical protein
MAAGAKRHPGSQYVRGTLGGFLEGTRDAAGFALVRARAIAEGQSCECDGDGSGRICLDTQVKSG